MDNVIVDPVGNGTAMTKQNSETSSINSNNSMRSTERQTLPGTAAWKKARLLERNRIAASKCRQRKKVAQEQLQKDVVILRNSNKIMKTKLDYYQKLVSKFKRFMELHMESCGGNKDGLTMIEEMLKIDHDLHLDEKMCIRDSLVTFFHGTNSELSDVNDEINSFISLLMLSIEI